MEESAVVINWNICNHLDCIPEFLYWQVEGAMLHARDQHTPY